MTKRAPLFTAARFSPEPTRARWPRARERPRSHAPQARSLRLPQQEKDHSCDDTTEEISSGIIGQTASAETIWHQAYPNQAVFNPTHLSLAGQSGFVRLAWAFVFSGA